MFTNKKFLIATLILSVLTAGFLFFYFRKSEPRALSPAINAVPQDAALILETGDTEWLLNKVLLNENLAELLSDFAPTRDFYRMVKLQDSLIKNYPLVKDFFADNKLIVSMHKQGDSYIDFLFAAGSSANAQNEDSLNLLINKLFPHLTKTEKLYDEAKIIKQVGVGNPFFYSFYKDYFLFSYSEILLQKSIKSINSNISLFSDPDFKSLYKLVKEKNDFTLYADYEKLYELSRIFLNERANGRLKLLRNFAGRTAFEVNLEKDKIKFSGHTSLRSDMQYLSIFKNARPQKSKIPAIIPAKTSSFLILNFGDGINFQTKYEDYLSKIKKRNEYLSALQAFYKSYGMNKDQENLYVLADDEVALVQEDFNKNGKEHNSFALIKVKSTKDTEYFMSKITDEFCKTNAQDSGKVAFLPVKNGKFEIKKTPMPFIPRLFFGAIFENLRASYYTFIDDYLIFGETAAALNDFVNAYRENKTFKRKSQGYDFINNLSEESNFFSYTDIFHSGELIKNMIKTKSEQTEEEFEKLTSVQGLAFQYIADSYPIYTSASIGLEAQENDFSESVWEVKLDTLIASKPYIVLNHNTFEKEIVVQDAGNKLYLLDRNGTVLWSRQLAGRIISEIYQIDYYKNNKLQLLFNTKNEIYGIDRKGNWLEGYPVKLPVEASNGICMVDYDNNKNYRIFVAGKNKKMYLYDIFGKSVKGWEFEKSKGIVNQKVEVFQDNNKDYVVFRDRTQLYFLNRRGQVRIKPEIDIPLATNSCIRFMPAHAKNKARFAVTNPSGVVYLIFEDGKVSRKNFKTFTENHYFNYADLNNDKFPEYIFTDLNRTTIFDGMTNKKISEFKYVGNVNYPPGIYTFGSNDIRIGTGTKNRIYLIDNQGNMAPMFPLSGSGPFSITMFNNSAKFSLIVGNKDNYLYKYDVK